jgi:hypothetical protein
LKNDEVDSVAALLGDLVAYRAQGASHLEVLAGVAMLKNQLPQPQSFSDKYKPAPAKELLEASILQPYAVAAYTVSTLHRLSSFLDIPTLENWCLGSIRDHSVFL